MKWFKFYIIQFSFFSSDPPIRVSDDPVVGDIGQTVSLVCDVCAFPSPTFYEWTFNDTDLWEGIDGRDTNTIVINGVTSDDFGDYTCEVINAEGNAYVDVIFEPYSKQASLESYCSRSFITTNS